MNLISELQPDVNLQILALLDLPDIIGCQFLSRSIYWSFRRNIFPNHFYFDFSKTNIKYLYYAIMYNKETIIKWLISHDIWNPSKFVILEQYYLTLALHRYILHRINYSDITMALATIYASKRIIQFFHEKKVKTIGFMDNPLFSFEGIELALAKKCRGNDIIYLFNNVIDKKRNKYNDNISDYRLELFIWHANKYKRAKRWSYQEMVY